MLNIDHELKPNSDRDVMNVGESKEERDGIMTYAKYIDAAEQAMLKTEKKIEALQKERKELVKIVPSLDQDLKRAELDMLKLNLAAG